jgi:hypothetical protein
VSTQTPLSFPLQLKKKGTGVTTDAFHGVRDWEAGTELSV